MGGANILDGFFTRQQKKEKRKWPSNDSSQWRLARWYWTSHRLRRKPKLSQMAQQRIRLRRPPRGLAKEAAKAASEKFF